LTVATFWRPNGRNIHRDQRAKESDTWGVLPDPGFEVPLTDQQFADMLRRQRQRDIMRHAPATAQTSEDDPHDPQLAKAREYLESKFPAAKSAQP
jgi:carboxyl-terminal processing protease